MARVRGIVVDSQYLVKGDVAERAEFNKQPELRVTFESWRSQEAHLG